MTQWHADVGTTSFVPGTELTVQSQHHVVRVITADTMMLEQPDGQRTFALVLDRTGPSMKLVLPDGHMVPLELVADESLLPPRAGSAFSSEIWVTH